MIANMRARKIVTDKSQFDDGTIRDMVVWIVPSPVPGSVHLYKYRLFFGRQGERIIEYDNERKKGDHVHRGSIEAPYQFTDLDTLILDFLNDVEMWRSRQ